MAAWRERIGQRPALTWVLAFLFLNVPVVAFGLVWLVGFPADWQVMEQLAGRLRNGTLYDHTPFYTWVWSPIAAWLVAYVLVPLGYGAMFAIRAATLPLLEWRLALLAVLSLPFWVDAVVGNFFIFPVVAGVLALRGNRWGALAFLALTCLMPRPIQLPLAAWLVWKRPDVRLPLLAMLGVSAVAAVASGYATDWLGVLVSLTTSYGTPDVNIGPTRLLGSAWLLVGLPLAAVLTMKGRVGWAGLALSPYVVPQYLLAILWEMVGTRRTIASRETDAALLTDRASAAPVNDGVLPPEAPTSRRTGTSAAEQEMRPPPR